jgi:hypothetical protein
MTKDFRDIADEENGSHAYYNWAAHRGENLPRFYDKD